MDLTNLRDSLDSSSRERHPARASAKKSELRLTRDFKAAALQLTTLYRSALSSSNRSYATGYAQSLSDILDVVLLRLQQPATTAPGFRSNSNSSNSNAESDREELRWLVRYLRARIEAIRVESEEEEREESDEEDVAEGQDLSRRIRGSHSVESQGSQRSIKDDNKPVSAAAPADQEGDLTLVGEGERNDTMANNATSAHTSDFTFSAPSGSITSSSNRNANQHGRDVDSNSLVAEPQVIDSIPSHHSSMISPSSLVRPSSDDDEDNLRQRITPPSRRHSNRLGKRMGGREKLSGLELFARAQNVKRRRGLGDRRDDDDGLL